MFTVNSSAVCWLEDLPRPGMDRLVRHQSRLQHRFTLPRITPWIGWVMLIWGVLMPIHGTRASSGGSTEQLAAVVNPRLRSLLDERDRLERRLPLLPKPSGQATSQAIGVHSKPAASPEIRKWFQVDLGSERQIDTIVLVPAQVAVGEYRGQGYGFPPRFRVEVSEDESFRESRIVTDHTREDFRNPLGNPVLFAVNGQKARYVRVTATRLWQQGEPALFALGELLVMAGERNLAAGRPVRVSDSQESLPQWAASHLVDGQSQLGLPIDLVPSESNGYHSKEQEMRQDAVKWVQVDLGRSLPLDEVRLVPSRPRDWVLVSGFGFPLRFRVEVSEDAEFREPIVIRPEDEVDFRNPGENLITIPCEGITGRFVRVTATKLWLRTDYYAFALAELQVISAGTNVAVGAHVEALDSVESGYWSARALVDNYSSQNRLVPMERWIAGLGRRIEIVDAVEKIDAQIEQETRKSLDHLVRGSIVSVFIVSLGAAFLSYRHRLVRTLELERLRTRISRDLHDEMGARLTRIGLLTHAVERQTDERHPIRSHASQISDMTREMVRTMDEIVWAVNPGNDTLEHLADYLLHFAQEFFRQSTICCRLEIPAELPEVRLSTEVRHHVFLAVKEALNNVARHSGAHNVQVRLMIEPGSLILVIEDDGVGFDPEAVRPGCDGLSNMRQRLVRTGGVLEVSTASGRGTVLTMRTPLGRGKWWWSRPQRSRPGHGA